MRLVAVLVVIALFFLAGIGSAHDSRDYIQVHEVTMMLENGDAVFEVQFKLDRLAKLYVLTLGSKHIEQDLIDIFKDFDNVSMKKAGSSRAVLVAHGAAEKKGGYCLFDPRPLGSSVPKFTVKYPEGISRTYHEVSETPNVFCEEKKVTNR